VPFRRVATTTPVVGEKQQKNKPSSPLETGIEGNMIFMGGIQAEGAGFLQFPKLVGLAGTKKPGKRPVFAELEN